MIIIISSRSNRFLWYICRASAASSTLQLSVIFQPTVHSYLPIKLIATMYLAFLPISHSHTQMKVIYPIFLPVINEYTNVLTWARKSEQPTVFTYGGFWMPLDEGKGVSGYNTVCLTMHHYRKYACRAIRYLHIKNLFSRFRKIAL